MHKWTPHIEHFIRGRCSTGGASFLAFATSTKYWQYYTCIFFELYKSFYVHPHSNVTRQRLTMIVCSYSLQAYQLFLYTIDGSLPTGLLATACVVTAGRHVVSALPYRIRLLTNSIEKCLWFRTLSLSTSTWLYAVVSVYSTYKMTRRISRQWRKIGTHVCRHQILGR